MTQSNQRPPGGIATWASMACLALVVAAAGTLFAAATDEYQKRLGKINSDLAADRFALGAWAQEQKLPAEARDQYERVLQVDPGNKDAASKIAEISAGTKKNRTPKCEITMNSGEKIKAELLIPMLQIDTASGPITIPVSDVDIIELGPPPANDRVTADAFVGHGQIKADSFAAQCKVGTINVQRVDVKLIRIFRPCPDCDGAGIFTCKRCNGTGKISADKAVCPKCGGKGKVKCNACNGTMKIKCALCGGSGRIQGMWGHRDNLPCPRCHGSGTVDCPECDNGWKTCPECNGKSSTGKPGVCPTCGGAGKVKCSACDGTGTKPPPKTEDEMKAEAEKANADTPKPPPGPGPAQ